MRTGELVALAGENGAGKTTLVRCIAGEVVPASGEVYFAGRRVTADQAAAVKLGIAVVWQDLALCDNLDIAANIMLGREPKRLLWSETRFHTAAASLLTSLQIPLKDTTRNVGSLSGAQRQLVAVARAMGRKPPLLALDEPTASLGVKEAAQVEELIMGLRGQGTTILLACHDIDQMFGLADRIVVLRQGRIVADLRTKSATRRARSCDGIRGCRRCSSPGPCSGRTAWSCSSTCWRHLRRTRRAPLPSWKRSPCSTR